MTAVAVRLTVARQAEKEVAVIDNASRTKAVFTFFMLVVALVLLAIVWIGAVGSRSFFTVQLMFTWGTFLASVGLAAAVWRRRLLIYATSIALLLIGAASLQVLVLRPDPSVDPLLFHSGVWTHGPVPLRVGWARAAMGLVIVASGLALPFSIARRHNLALCALTVLRLSLWAGAFWQVAYFILDGRFERLTDRAAALVQVILAMAMVVSWSVLLPGDRRWLRTLTDSDRTVSMARFILPVAMVPVIGAYLTASGTRLGLFAPDVGLLLNVEISSVTLLLVGVAALRSLWRERRGRETLANALERSPVIVHSEDGRIEYWPRGCEALYEYTAAEAVGRRSSELLQTRFPTPVKDIEATLHRQGEWAGELSQITRSGRRIWVASRLVVDRPTSDPGLKIVETLTDITDLKRTGAALTATNDAFAQAVATYELGIVDYDAGTGRTSFSPELERILGVKPGALGSDQRVWMSLMASSDAQRVTGWFYEDVRNPTTRRTLTIKVRRADGELRDLQGMLRYSLSADGNLERIVGIYMDVTDQLRDRAEVAARGARLMELQSELTHTSRLSAMGEMAAALAHELNQPLTAVGNSVGAIELILQTDKPLDDKVRQRVLRAAKHAEVQAVRAGEIVRRLREFIARGEADTQAEDLNDLIDDAIALALPNPGAVQVQVRKSIASEAANVLADRIQIQQVMVNLIRNAVEAMREQDTPRILTIAATASDGMALIRVADTGVGVADEAVETLFSPFLSTKRDGMGVGLSICRRIVEAHEGKMWFQPAEGGGAEFRFTVPLISREAKYVGN